MKVELGAKNCLYPSLTVLVGATVDGRPNYLTIAWVGILDHATISVAMNKAHYTNAGIKQNGTFSVNVPSQDMVVDTDYCGLVSGAKTDKAGVFQAFYGKLPTAPMIVGCPVNMECRLIQTLDRPRHDVFIGEIVETYCEESCVTDGSVDFGKLRPILFTMFDKGYWRLGERFATAWSIGRERTAPALAILSDVHGHLPALEAVLHDAASKEVAAIIVAGDLLTGGPFPAQTLRRLRSAGCHMIRGNAEDYLAPHGPGRNDRQSAPKQWAVARRTQAQLVAGSLPLSNLRACHPYT